MDNWPQEVVKEISQGVYSYDGVYYAIRSLLVAWIVVLAWCDGRVDGVDAKECAKILKEKLGDKKLLDYWTGEGMVFYEENVKGYFWFSVGNEKENHERIRLLYRNVVLQREVMIQGWNSDTIVPVTLNFWGVCIETFPLSHNIRFGLLRVDPSKFQSTTNSRLCLLYLDCNHVELLGLKTLDEIRLLGQDGRVRPGSSGLTSKVGDFLRTAAVGRPGGLERTELVADSQVVVVVKRGKHYFTERFGQKSELSSLFKHGEKIAVMHLKTDKVWSQDDKNLLQVIVRFSSREVRLGKTIDYEYLFEGDQHSTVSDLFRFITEDILLLADYEKTIHIKELFKCTVFSSGLPVTNMVAEMSRINNETPLSEIKHELKQMLKDDSEEADLPPGTRSVELVATVGFSELIPFDYLPKKTAKRECFVKFDLGAFLNYTLIEGTNFPLISYIEDPYFDLTEFLFPTNLIIPFSGVLSKFCRLSRSITFLEGQLPGIESTRPFRSTYGKYCTMGCSLQTLDLGHLPTTPPSPTLPTQDSKSAQQSSIPCPHFTYLSRPNPSHPLLSLHSQAEGILPEMIDGDRVGYVYLERLECID